MQIRPDYDSEIVLLELTDTSGSTGITLGGEEGTIDIRIGALDTAALDPGDDISGKIGVYDLLLIETTDPSHVIRILKGSVFVSSRVTV